MQTPIKIQVDQDTPSNTKQLCAKGQSIWSNSFGVYSPHTYHIHIQSVLFPKMSMNTGYTFDQSRKNVHQQILHEIYHTS